MQTLLHDPPLARDTGDRRYRPLAEILQADFVTLHVPLTLDGPDATFHLIGADELAHMASSSILINTARGEVVDNAALLAALTKGTIGDAVLDVWEKEPAIDWESPEPGDARHAAHCRLLLRRKDQGNGDAVSRLLPLLGNRARLWAPPPDLAHCTAAPGTVSHRSVCRHR